MPSSVGGTAFACYSAAMNRFALLTLAGLAFVSLPACSADGDQSGAAGVDEVNATSTISFKAEGFKVETTGKLAAGGKVLIQYDPARLPGCRGNVGGGGPGWSISGYASFNGQPATTFEVTKLNATRTDREPAPYELKLPEGGDLAIWFHVASRWGCSEYDSQYGQNFHFDVAGPPPEADSTLTFHADGKVDQTKPLKAGAKVAVRYEQDRLQTCRSTYNGRPAWAITGHARINGGEEQSFSTARPVYGSGEEREPLDNLVRLGESGQLELWFENSGRDCVGWDSQDGKNYRFPIEP